MNDSRPKLSILTWLLSNEYRPHALLQLLWPRTHPPLIAARRNSMVLSRVRALAGVFAILTTLWIPIDLLTLPAHVASVLMVMRIAASGALFYLMALTRRRASLWRLYRSLALLYFIPTVFYFTSLMLLRSPGLGPYAHIALEVYWVLPVVAMAGLGIFPLTIAESAAFSIPIIVGELIALYAHLGVFFPGGIIDATWLMILMGGIAVFVGMSQLSFAIVLVGQSVNDVLTGCYTRRSVSELLDLHFRVSSRVGYPLAVAFLDLDHFKNINDQFGHEVGDHVLASAAQGIQAALHGTECAGRWGGEEFVIVFPGKSAPEAIGSIQQIRSTGLARCPGPRAVTVSVGVAERTVDHCADWSSLVRTADERMYAAKKAGRDRVCGPAEARTVCQPITCQA